MIVKAKVIDTYEIMLMCDRCGKKMMSGYDYDLQENQYVYRCSCGYEVRSSLHYPFTKVVYNTSDMETISEAEALAE